MKHPMLEIAPGVHCPMLGVGTWRMSEAEADSAVSEALRLGYRHVDTASLYKNEAAVGRAVRASKLAREEIFVTTKCWNDAIRGGAKAVVRAFEDSLARLDLGYVDLYLLHWPCKGAYVEAWKGMCEIAASGKARSVGVSNFLVHHLEEVLDVSPLVPANNQIELHPRLQSKELVSFCRRMKISVTAWSPLMQGKLDTVPELGEIARAHGKSPAQVALRWNVQSGIITIPKSTRRERLVENAGIFDFSLTEAEMARIGTLDRMSRLGPNPDNFTF